VGISAQDHETHSGALQIQARSISSLQTEHAMVQHNHKPQPAMPSMSLSSARNFASFGEESVLKIFSPP